MSDTTTEPAEPTTTEEPTTQGEPAEEPLGENGKKALDSERAARKEAERQAAELKKQLDEIHRANETAIERAQREAKEAQESAATATLTAFREAAVKFGGISEDDADLFLTGTDVETLQKQAARLMERTPTAPRPDPSQGGRGEPAKGSTADQFAAAISDALN